jgi:hypothetical protein
MLQLTQDFSTSSSVNGTSCVFAVTVNDNLALNPDGQWIFGTNNTGSWVWNSAVNFTSTPQQLQILKYLIVKVGDTVAYEWNFTDNAGNVASTGLLTLLVS